MFIGFADVFVTSGRLALVLLTMLEHSLFVHEYLCVLVEILPNMIRFIQIWKTYGD